MAVDRTPVALPSAIPAHDGGLILFQGLCQWERCRAKLARFWCGATTFIVEDDCAKCGATSEFKGTPYGIAPRLVSGPRGAR